MEDLSYRQGSFPFIPANFLFFQLFRFLIFSVHFNRFEMDSHKGICAEGYAPQVRALLKRFGAAQLSAVEPDHYRALLEQAQAIGNEVDGDG